MRSRVYSPSPLILLGLILFGICFASCAPLSYSAPTQAKRCCVVVTSQSCTPCRFMKTVTFPKLTAKGLKIAAYRDQTQADIHTVDSDLEPAIVKSWNLDDLLPATVVFEGQKIVETRYGALDEHTVYRLLGRDDLINTEPPTERVETEKPAPVADHDKSPWDQITELIGCDNSVFTLHIPNGRKITIPDANAAVHLPETLTGHVKLVGDTIQIDFDKPLLQVEAKRLGIRLGTSIPSVTLSKDPFVATFHTGIGIPYRWKLESNPFPE